MATCRFSIHYRAGVSFIPWDSFTGNLILFTSSERRVRLRGVDDCQARCVDLSVHNREVPHAVSEGPTRG